MWSELCFSSSAKGVPPPSLLAIVIAHVAGAQRNACSVALHLMEACSRESLAPLQSRQVKLLVMPQSATVDVPSSTLGGRSEA